MSDCIFEIHHLWQSDFSRMYSNFCCSSSLEPEIIKIGQSPHKMYSNNILNFQESMPILNAQMKKVRKLIVCTLYIWWGIMVIIIGNGTRWHEFKSWTRLIAFHIALITLGKVWIQLFSLQLWVNNRADWFLQPWWGN